MAEVGPDAVPHADDPWIVLADDRVVIRLVDARAGGAPDLVELIASLDGSAVRRMNQVHGSDVAFVATDGAADPPPRADAMVTVGGGLSLVVRTADCVPVVLWDAKAGVTAVAHAGWRGIVGGVVPAAIDAMVGLGARVASADDVGGVRAWVGPSICAACYPVGQDVLRQVVAVSPAAHAPTFDGHPALDVAAGVVQQLTASGVVHIDHDHRCTREDPQLFSARGGDAVARLQVVVSAR